MAIITVTDVRNSSGATTELIDDTTIQAIIDDSQAQALSSFKIFLEPTEVLEIRDGNGKNQIRINRPYIWKLTELQTRINTSESTIVDIEDTTIDPISSLVILNTFTGVQTTTYSYFYQIPNGIRMKYLSAFMEKTTTITETTADIAVGTSVDIAVSSESGFSVDDWVLIEGLDGKREAAKITATTTNQITVDELVQSHLSGSVVSLLQTHELLKQFILYDANTNVANYIVGNTSNLPTSYSIEGATATIGVAYTHWRESADRFASKRDEFKNKILAKIIPLA